jgi:D-methionine transport system permease protein
MDELLPLLLEASLETLGMVAAALLIATLIGGPLGAFLATGGPGELLAAPRLRTATAAMVNATRSVPFIILAVAIIPVTRFVVGTSIGTQAAVVPLALAAIPFLARIVETALREVDPGLVEAARAMGGRPLPIVWKVLLPEARPALVSGLTLTAITLIGFSAVVGVIGGGGLGDLGIRYGYQRFRPDVMLAVVLVLIALVQGIQAAGDLLARRFDRRRT